MPRASFHAEFNALFSCGNGVKLIWQLEQKKWKKRMFLEFQAKRRNSRHENSEIFRWKGHLRDKPWASFDAKFNALFNCGNGVKRVWEKEQKNWKERKFVEFQDKRRNSRHENVQVCRWRKHLRDRPGQHLLRNLILYSTVQTGEANLAKKSEKMEKERMVVEFQIERRNSRHENSQIFPWMGHFRDKPWALFDAEFNALFNYGNGVKGIWQKEQKEWKKSSCNMRPCEGTVATKILRFSHEGDTWETSQGHYSMQNVMLYSTVGQSEANLRKWAKKMEKNENRSKFRPREGTVTTKILRFCHQGDAWERRGGHHSMVTSWLYESQGRRWGELVNRNSRKGEKWKLVELRGMYRRGTETNFYLFCWGKHLRAKITRGFDAEKRLCSTVVIRCREFVKKSRKRGKNFKFVEFRGRWEGGGANGILSFRIRRATFSTEEVDNWMENWTV